MPNWFVDSLRYGMAALRPMASEALSGLMSGRTLARRTALVPAVLGALTEERALETDGWTAREARWSDTGVAIIPIGPRGEPAQLVVKFADRRPTLDALQAQERRLADLHADSRLTAWATIVPRVVHTGAVGAFPYFVETAMTGLPATRIFRDAPLRQRLLPIAAAAIAELHRRTSATVRVDDAALESWVDGPVRTVATALAGRRGAGAQARAALDDLGRELRTGLADREASIGWIHGDFWPGNILARADGGLITGIVDWDLASEGQLALHDPVHLVLLTRRLATRRDLGDVVRGLVAGDPLDVAERSALAAGGLGTATWEREGREAVLLAWLRHVGLFAPIPGHGSNPRWISRNVLAVLDAIPRGRSNGATR